MNEDEIEPLDPEFPYRVEGFDLGVLLVVLLGFLLAGCAGGDRGYEGPLWEREGGILNPWGGEFLDL